MYLIYRKTSQKAVKVNIFLPHLSILPFFFYDFTPYDSLWPNIANISISISISISLHW